MKNARTKRLSSITPVTHRDPGIRSRIFFSTVNGGVTRAAARTPGAAKDTVTNAKRSIEAALRLKLLRLTEDFFLEGGTDEMRSFAGDKSRQSGFGGR
jgi:hypothetical protein